MNSVTRVQSGQKGARLLTLMRQKAAAEQSALEDCCFRLGISYPVIASIETRRRTWEELGSGVLRKIAHWLGISLLQVYLHAEILEPQDLLADLSLEKQFGDVINKMREDLAWGGLTPSPELLSDLPPQVKIMIALLYSRSLTSGLVDFVAEKVGPV